MKIYFTSFRTKIIITLILVISVFSFFSFSFFSHYLSRRIYSSTEESILDVMRFLRDEINVIHDGKLIKPLLGNLSRDKQLFNTYLFDSDGKIKLPVHDDSLGILASTRERLIKDSLDFEKLISSKDDISITKVNFGDHPVSRAFLRVRNTPVCYACHSPETQPLGYIVLDFSMKETQENIDFTRNFTIFFAVAMMLIILVFVFIMHYRFVKMSLFRFHKSIRIINEGDLTERVLIPESKELADLGECFNKMMDTFQRTQDELFYYHQKELNDANKLATVGEMAARLAHEVRNPLMGIANSIEIIIGDMKDSPNIPILEEIKRQASRVNTAISNLLKYSRSTDVKFNDGDINETVNKLIFFLKNQKQNKAIDFVVDLQPDVPRFTFDVEQIENVLLNLGINAIQAIKGEGKIIFRTKYHREDKKVTFSIQDNGAGIPDDKALEVFKPFFTTRTEGTGLGLAISKDIIEKHHGKIWFQNNESGGCTFAFSLPVDVM